MINGKDLSDLKRAKTLLEKESLAVKMANLFGDAAEKAVRVLPDAYQKFVEIYTVAAIGKSWEFTMTTMPASDIPSEHERRHRLYAIISGAVGGVGIMTLFAELPVTTVIMLRAVADIAKEEGEDYSLIETKLACLEVFAFGNEAVDKDTGVIGYYAIRASLEKPIQESSRYIAKKGVAGMGAPFAAQLIAKIAARYQTAVSAKIAARVVPAAGAIIGAAVNIVFINLFQDKARGHFIVRRLERKYGDEEVRRVYQELRQTSEVLKTSEVC